MVGFRQLLRIIRNVAATKTKTKRYSQRRCWFVALLRIKRGKQGNYFYPCLGTSRGVWRGEISPL
jgi:hypothetical protein